jgi:hypothetical protein
MSFAQEMKDFIAASEAGQKMIGAQSDEAYKQVKSKYTEEMTKTLQKKNDDEEGDAAELALKQAKVRNVNAATGLSQGRLGFVNDQRKALGAVPAPGAGYSPANSTIAPAVSAQPNAPDAQPIQQAVPAGPAAFPDPQEPAQVAFKNGGAVQHFAGGGAVGDDEELPAAPAPATEATEAPDDGAETPEEDAPEGAVPYASAGTSDTTDISSRSRTPGYSTAAGFDAVHAGLTHNAELRGLHTPGGVMTPGRQRAAQSWATGAHAASPDEMNAVMKAVDPDNKLPESSRSLAAIGAMYQFKMAHGDPAGAASAAGAMIDYYRQASQRYAVIAAAAAQKGDIDTATHAAMKAYANVPDGQNFQVQKTPDGKLSYTMTDEKTGKVTSQGIETPEKLAASAMGFAANGFDESLMAAVQRRPAQKAAVDPNSLPMKAADKKSALAAVDKSYAAQNPAPEAADDQAPAAPARPKDEEIALKGAALRIGNHTANGRTTPDEAMSLATKLFDPTVLGKSKVKADPAPGGYAVSIDGSQPKFVSSDDWAAAMVSRNAKLEAVKQKTADAAKPNAAARVIAAAKGIAKPAMDYLNAPADAVTRRKQAAARATFTDPQVP